MTTKMKITKNCNRCMFHIISKILYVWIIQFSSVAVLLLSLTYWLKYYVDNCWALDLLFMMSLGNLRAQPSYLKAKLGSQYWDQEWQPLNHQPLCQVIRMLRNSQLRILQNLQPRRRSLQAPTRTKMPMVRRKPTEVQRLAVPCSKLI